MMTFLSRATIVALALAASLFPARSQAQNPTGTSVAVIDLGEVFDKHERMTAQLEEVKQDIQAFEAYVRQERQKIEALAEQLRTYVVGKPEYVEKEKELAAAQADLQVQMRQKSREFLEREAKVRFNAYQEIIDLVTRFAQQYHIQLVIRFHRQPIDASKPESVQFGLNRPIVYQNSLDITDHIVQMLKPTHPPTNVSGRSGPSIPGRTQR
ncbi:MAG: OmpH family outer membrane protein [Planctomycetes bacterium]|nr:OmpH family outer membrane protein [Planctomycetota bacterium]